MEELPSTQQAGMDLGRSTVEIPSSSLLLAELNATYKSLGLNVVVSVPESVDEYNQLAGTTDAALNDATDSTVYRSVLNVFREAVVAAIAEDTGTARIVKYKLDAEGNPVLDDETKEKIVDTEESAGAYMRRVAGDSPEKFQSIADSVAKTLVFDPKVKERAAAGPKDLAKRYKEAAQGIIDAGLEVAQAVASELASKHSIVVEVFTTEDADGETIIDQPKTIESLGNAIRVDQTKVNLASQYTKGLV